MLTMRTLLELLAFHELEKSFVSIIKCIRPLELFTSLAFMILSPTVKAVAFLAGFAVELLYLIILFQFKNQWAVWSRTPGVVCLSIHKVIKRELVVLFLLLFGQKHI